jgi:hypothetical protein
MSSPPMSAETTHTDFCFFKQLGDVRSTPCNRQFKQQLT